MIVAALFIFVFLRRVPVAESELTASTIAKRGILATLFIEASSGRKICGRTLTPKLGL